MIGLLLLIVKPALIDVWRWCSGVAFVVFLVFGITIHTSFRHRSLKQLQGPSANFIFYSFTTLGWGATLLQLLNVALLGAFWPFFRGIVLQLFRVTEQAFGTWVGVAVSAIAFGSLHGLNPNASLAASIAIILESGILLAAADFATRTLWFPIGLHFGWNFAEDFIFCVRLSGHAARPAIVEGPLTGSPLWTGGAYGLESSISAIGMAAILSAILIAIEIVRFMPNRKFAATVS